MKKTVPAWIWYIISLVSFISLLQVIRPLFEFPPLSEPFNDLASIIIFGFVAVILAIIWATLLFIGGLIAEKIARKKDE